MTFGAADFTNDVGMTWTAGEDELTTLRVNLVVASRAAGIEQPVDTVWVDLKDGEGLEASSRTALGFGFQGKMCIHPDQIGKALSRMLGPGWTAHTLRHRFASRAYAVDRDLRSVQELLGHSKPETTMRYTAIPDGALRAAVMGAG